ncbi:class I SAM-dependent rRNA methyltransferase [Candidatus Caldatribacterium sp. SIUC1]|uniref:class I SAM-dependent rRNA methyltransferase n=1 Tax=Candidatus Caldatribacterium sp. SIUC1 TaxID=3418365 RepID=UPI003F68BD31
MTEYARVRLKKGKEKRVLLGHPWVYRTDIEVLRGPADPGDVVLLENHRGKPLALGYYNPSSVIAVRVLTRNPEERIDRDFFLRRMQQALELRLKLFREATTNAFRVVFAEADFLPGLIVDRFASLLVVQFLTLGMEKRRGDVVEALEVLLHPEGIYERSDVEVRKREGLEERTGWILPGGSPEVVIKENGLAFFVDVARGQKTGYFLDQRENRLSLRRYVQGARVLDCFSYTGGFAIHAAAFGAKEVLGLDISESAVALARENARLNRLEDRVRFEVADVFEALRELFRKGERFDLVILDPPAFVKGKEALEGALRGYKDINLLAMKLLVPSGTLVTCSCSYHLSEDLFLEVLKEASQDAGRRLQILEQRGQAQDHPVLVGYPESRYLKCFILRVL